MSFKVCKYTGVFKKRMLEVIKKQLDANKFTLYRIVYYSYFSDEHISTFNSSPVSRRPHSSKSVWMHHLASLVSNFLSRSNFQNNISNSTRLLHFASLLLKFSQQFKLPKTSFQIASQCTIYRPRFQTLLSSSKIPSFLHYSGLLKKRDIIYLCYLMFPNVVSNSNKSTI